MEMGIATGRKLTSRETSYGGDDLFNMVIGSMDGEKSIDEKIPTRRSMAGMGCNSNGNYRVLWGYYFTIAYYCY